MDKEIARLVDSYGDSIFPYLRLRAAFALGDDLNILTKEQEEDLEASGFITRNPITLFEGNRWLYMPPEAKVKQKKEPWIKKEIEELAFIVGYPDDWHKQGKYLTLYNKIVKVFPHNKLLDVANYIKNDEIENASLGYLLTERGMRKYTRDMQERESMNLTQDRKFDGLEGF